MILRFIITVRVGKKSVCIYRKGDIPAQQLAVGRSGGSGNGISRLA